jgi:hypothetical protein
VESPIGKGKQLMGRNKNGYTKTVLAMAAGVMAITTETIQNALAGVKVKDVQPWIDENLGTSLQAQRQRVLGVLGVPASGTKAG